jgi:hypothetical protein
MTKQINVTEDHTIHHPFKPPEYRCQICGSDDEEAHAWRCKICGYGGNPEWHVHKKEDVVWALITASATLHPLSLSQCSSQRTERRRRYLHRWRPTCNRNNSGYSGRCHCNFHTDNRRIVLGHRTLDMPQTVVMHYR